MVFMEIRKSLEQPRMHVEYVKPFFYESIANGTKTIELRIKDGKLKDVQAGDIIEFKTRMFATRVKVKDVRVHYTFDDLFEKEDIGKVAPALTIEYMRENIGSMFETKKMEYYGLLAIEFEKINE